MPLAPGPGGTQGARGLSGQRGTAESRGCAGWGTEELAMALDQLSLTLVRGAALGPGCECRALAGGAGTVPAGCGAGQQSPLLLSYHSQEWLGAAGVLSQVA